jgi:protein-S-isoprenylcysteine O-methyltransferase Ste14
MAEPTQDHAGVIAPPPLLYAVPLGLGLLLERASPAPLLPRTVARPLGGLLVAGATAVEAWFILTMRQAATPISPRKPVARLVTDGPFRFSRNPSYLALAAFYIGIASLVNTRWPLFLLPAVLLLVQRGVIEREEQYLERTFGDEYHRYGACVRRWL